MFRSNWYCTSSTLWAVVGCLSASRKQLLVVVVVMPNSNPSSEPEKKPWGHTLISPRFRCGEGLPRHVAGVHLQMHQVWQPRREGENAQWYDSDFNPQQQVERLRWKTVSVLQHDKTNCEAPHQETPDDRFWNIHMFPLKHGILRGGRSDQKTSEKRWGTSSAWLTEVYLSPAGHHYENCAAWTREEMVLLNRRKEMYFCNKWIDTFIDKPKNCKKISL